MLIVNLGKDGVRGEDGEVGLPGVAGLYTNTLVKSCHILK